ncbi:hypothetical protein [Amycolatopsis sp. MJM2582]|uniref:hypothetical protein n=1 Tax=Amycolatopsis sp. MJM2582 TaxID=1427749 RepID=UPI00055FBAE4|nr:hypothetical protein [Amycolatopsis sp. MJM2582]
MTGAVDLFGNPVDEPVTTGPAAPPINDMTLIEKVLQVAENTGYVLVGPSERVYHLVARKTIEAAPRPEEEAVHQLLTAKWLTKGGVHVYTHHGFEGPGNSVLVPKTTKVKARQWRSLAPIPCSRKRKAS